MHVTNSCKFIKVGLLIIFFLFMRSSILCIVTYDMIKKFMQYKFMQLALDSHNFVTLWYIGGYSQLFFIQCAKLKSWEWSGPAT